MDDQPQFGEFALGGSESTKVQVDEADLQLSLSVTG
jgi:hypothetical protein